MTKVDETDNLEGEEKKKSKNQAPEKRQGKDKKSEKREKVWKRTN